MTNEQFSENVRLHHNMVFRIALSYVGNHADAQDITQDAFLKLLQSKKSFKSDEHIKAWLIRVTINLSKNMIKASKYTLRDELTDDIPANTGEPLLLGEYLKRLTPEQRTAICLQYYGYTVKEIAKMCGVTVSAVNMRLSRGKSELAKMLGKGE